jgi:hypothetical protein
MMTFSQRGSSFSGGPVVFQEAGEKAMSIKVQCPGCQAKLSVREDNSGQAHRCPRCQQPIAIDGKNLAYAVPVATMSPASGAPRVPKLQKIRSRAGRLLKWVLISLTVVCVAIPVLLLSLIGLAALIKGSPANSQAATSSGGDSSGGDGTTAAENLDSSIAAYTAPVIETPQVDTAAQEAAARNQEAWRQLDLCNNRNDRLSRDSQLEYWEAMRQGYGEIDVRNVDWEFAGLVEDYRTLFLDYANTHRQWTQERQPLVNVLEGVPVPESFAEGLVVGFAGGVTMQAIDELDTRYRNQLSAMQPRMEELNQKAGTLRATMTTRHGVSM